MTPRRRPRWSELRPLLRPRAVALDATGRRLAGTASIGDLRSMARRRAPRAVFDYTDGGAGDELSLRRSRAAFASVEFRPRVLQDVSTIDTGTVLLGRPAALPLVFGPTGFTRMMHTEGEPAVARVAARTGIPYALSTMGTTSIERLAAAAPDCRRWFQLYLWRDRGASRDFVARARAAGYDALVLTVDTPVAGPRRRDVRNGLTLPPSLSLRHGRRGGAAPVVVVRPAHHRAAGVRLAQPVRRHRGRAGGPHVRPGRDRRRPGLAARGMARTVGGQGDPDRRGCPRWSSTRAPTRSSSPTTAGVSSTGRRRRWSALPAVVDAVGDRAEVYVDGGIMSGSDVVAAVALGARAVAGRAGLPLRPDGRRRAGRAARGRHPRRGGARHDGAARRHARRRPFDPNTSGCARG